MKSDLYMKKSSFSYYQGKLVLLQKLSALCISKSIRWIFLYIFPQLKHNMTLSKKEKEKREKKKKKRNALETYCYPQVSDTLIWRILPTILNSEIRFLQFSCTLFYNSVVHRFKSSCRKQKKIFILEHIQLPPTNCSHISATIFIFWLSKQVTATSTLN